MEVDLGCQYLAPMIAPATHASVSPRFGVDGAVVWHALEATRAAAIAAAACAGRGDPKAADGAATAAMRSVLRAAPWSGVVITGEGAKDEAPMLADGEWLGEGAGEYDIAVDPLECTDLCAAGLPGALATIAVAPRGSLWSPGPAHYMDKLVLPAWARDSAHLGEDPLRILEQVSGALGGRRAVRVVVLDKPRHGELIARLRAAGAQVSTPTAGDVAGALEVILPEGRADLLLGVGGTPEGVMAACAARALGAGFEGRVAPQREAEAAAIARAGMPTDRVLTLAELVRADATFIATGVTGGLLAAPRTFGGRTVTESLLIAGGGVRRIHHSTPTED
jgi:fructose-1,6-bisphosphatase II